MRDEQFIARCIIGFMAVAVVILLLDEYAYFAWKKANPGAMFSVITDKGPINPHSGSMDYGGVPNGYKPGGSGYVAG